MKMEMRKLKDEIKAKNGQIALLEKKIAESFIVSPNKLDQLEISQVSLDFRTVGSACTFFFLKHKKSVFKVKLMLFVVYAAVFC